MTFRPFFVVLFLSSLPAGTALAAGDVQPKAGSQLSGTIQFPREQQMRVEADSRDGTKLKVRVGFDGKCTGGGLQEAWASTVLAKQTVRVRDGQFSADLTGSASNLGGVKGRTGEFTWKVTGRFLSQDVASATVSGTALIKSGKRVISRCKIAEPTSVRLAVRSSR
jgi:hypothetical protein